MMEKKLFEKKTCAEQIYLLREGENEEFATFADLNLIFGVTNSNRLFLKRKDILNYFKKIGHHIPLIDSTKVQELFKEIKDSYVKEFPLSINDFVETVKKKYNIDISHKSAKNYVSDDPNIKFVIAAARYGFDFQKLSSYGTQLTQELVQIHPSLFGNYDESALDNVIKK